MNTFLSKPSPTVRHILRCIPALIWMGLIFLLSSVPDLKSELPSQWDFVFRKAAHMFEYFILALLLWYPLHFTRLFKSTQFLLIVIVTFLYAVSDEFHQQFVQGRVGSTKDVGIDMIGLIAFALVWLYVLRKQKRH